LEVKRWQSFGLYVQVLAIILSKLLDLLVFQLPQTYPPQKKRKRTQVAKSLHLDKNNGCQLYDHIKKLVKANFLITK